MMIIKPFFTADEHYGHKNIIEYSNRPFRSVDEMDETLIANFNSVVPDNENSITIHAGDFTLWKKTSGVYKKYVSRLNGNHIFLKGSHDYWLNDNAPRIWERILDKQYIVVCHYAMRTWARSHYNSWQLYGHSHGKLEPVGKQWDIGVDNNNFMPVSFHELKTIMANRPDNPNFIKRR